MADTGVSATMLVIAPPLRTALDQTEIWKALANGDLSVVATDHCPYTLAQKSAGLHDFTRVPGGSGGVETRWALLFTEGVAAGRLSAERWATLWATNPARIFGLHPQKGSLMIGGDADLILVNPERQSRISIENLHMHTDHTPYEGRAVQGYPLTTILRGQVVVRDGELDDRPLGKVVSRRWPAQMVL